MHPMQRRSADWRVTTISGAGGTTCGPSRRSTSAPAMPRKRNNYPVPISPSLILAISPSHMLTPYLGRVSAGENLTMDEMAAVMEEVMTGRCAENEIALLLTALRAKGETADEIAGAAQVMRRHMLPIRSSRQGIVDTCGTGGVGSD